MKKLLISICVFAMVVILFSFYTEKRTKEKYAWFNVQIGRGISCNNFSSVTPNDLKLIPRINGLTAIQSIQAACLELSYPESIEHFNCPAGIFVCAVGYALKEIDFQFVLIDGVQFVKPKKTAVELNKICRSVE